jgi:hypothetical protein
LRDPGEEVGIVGAAFCARTAGDDKRIDGTVDVGACGFKSADAMRRTFLRVLGVTAGEYASRFKSTLVRSSVS